MTTNQINHNVSKGVRWRWTIAILITLIVGVIVFLGPESHSNIDDAPTLKSKLGTILTTFLISGSIFLQVKGKSLSHRIGQGIVVLCSLVVGVVIISNISTLKFDLSSHRMIFKWLTILFCTLFLGFLIKRLRSAFGKI